MYYFTVFPRICKLLQDISKSNMCAVVNYRTYSRYVQQCGISLELLNVLRLCSVKCRE